MKIYVVNKNGTNEVVKSSKPTGDWASYIVCELPPQLDGKAFKIIEELGEFGTVIKRAVLDEVAEQQRLEQVALVEIQRQKDAELAQMQNRFNVAHKVKAKIALINKSKGWTSSDILTYLADPTIQAISNLLSEISFGTALQLLNSSDLSAYYTQEEVEEVKQMIQDHLNSEV